MKTRHSTALTTPTAMTTVLLVPLIADVALLDCSLFSLAGSWSSVWPGG